MMNAQYAVIEAAQESSMRRSAGFVMTAWNASSDSPNRSRKDPSTSEVLPCFAKRWKIPVRTLV
jgi:hypothetical protein